MKGGPATIKDIAKSLGISFSTVSRALRNHPDVNKETREAVQKLADKLNYSPNVLALNFKTNKTNTLGVIIPGFIIHFYASAISGIQNEAARAGYNVIICQSDESYETEKKNIEVLLKSRVDGFIVSVSKNTGDYEHFKQLEKKGRPLVFFNRVCPDIDASKVVVDDYRGAYKAVEHLIEEGCTRIAHIAGPPNLIICKNRLNGYLDALKQHNFPIDESLIVECDFSLEQGKEATLTLLKGNRPDGIFVVNDGAAFGCMQALKEQQVAIPAEIAVVGFTNEPLCDLIEPSLTTVSQPTYEIGQVAAQLLLQQIQGGIEEFAPQTQVLDAELIIRNSSRKKTTPAD